VTPLPVGHRWASGQIKHLADVTLGKMLQSSNSGNDVLANYMRAANVQPDGILMLEPKQMWFSASELDSLNLRRGDAVVVEGGVGGYGRAAYLSEDLPGWGFQNSINRLRPLDDNDGRFLAYYLMALRASGYIERYCNVVSMPHLTAEKLAALPAPIPEAHEQRVIADYLDRETDRIDTLIEEQQRLIELSRERRRAMRTRGALGGTRVTTDTVASPLPWVDQLPADWQVVPLTSVARLESGHTPSRTREDWWQDCYIPWISLNDVGAMRESKYLESTTNRLSDAGIANSSARLLPANTVVLSRDATVGRASIMKIPMATSQHFAAWICGPRLDPEYLWTLFTDAMQPYFDSFQNGSTIRTIGMGDLKSFRIPLPPIDEQRRIVAYLDEQTAKIDALIAETGTFIELSRERRSALIAAAVTGQIDVREVV
jgi:type I restriction enzyme S subunit